MSRLELYELLKTLEARIEALEKALADAQRH